ncbi:hypothetical protein PCASD_10061 [Puccinia coronata f. sp. avenae]|uniref:Uncharacterized protein n=1 Tax=Puccinia coronata f. sp. avenae TaxID=200324 RepID=A0A2N5UJM4_9BASI|nr:hypothetical protein PCASD_10061 [Puccinia coronata f. sp. avenae]
MDIMFYINNYIQDLISDALLSPFGQAKQKLHHLSSTSFWPNLQTAAKLHHLSSTSFWPNLQTAAVRKPLTQYGKFS